MYWSYNVLDNTLCYNYAVVYMLVTRPNYALFVQELYIHILFRF